MSIYAQETSVSVEKTRAEIEATLARYGAVKFAYMTAETSAVIMFVAHGKGVRFQLPLPPRDDIHFTIREFRRMGKLVSKQPRTPDEAYRAWEQACRSLWRSLFLCVKAKLEAVNAGITSFEAEFLAHIITPNGRTLGENVIPQLEEMTRAGRMPQLMLEAPQP